MDSEARAAILASLPEEASLLLVLDRLRDEVRANPLGQGERRERVAEHSWFVAVAVPLLAGFSPEPIDVARATLLAVVHDLAEAFTGDTFAFGPDVAGQRVREHLAMDALDVESRSAAITTLVGLWRDYEDQATPEARFVKGLDAFLPILLNFANIEHSSWVEHGVRAAQVSARLDRVRDFIGRLAAINDQMISQARADGHLT